MHGLSVHGARITSFEFEVEGLRIMLDRCVKGLKADQKRLKP